MSDAKVRRDGHVRFDNKYYSLDEKMIGKDVLVLATSSQVSIYHQGKLCEVHARIPSNDPLRAKSTKAHHLKPWEREMRNGSLYRKRAQALGPDVDRLVLELLNQGQGFIDTRKIWGILSLDKSFTAAQVNEACRQALEFGTLSYRMVKSILKLLPTKPGKTPDAPRQEIAQSKQESAPNKFVRPMSVYEEQLHLLH